MHQSASSSADIWVFGYGSLMWRPGFEFTERQIATVRGYHRSLCVYSHVHRGTPEKPGLVLGLDRGGSCKGIAFRVPAAATEATIAYLRAREQVTSVYRELHLRAELADGRHVMALSYAADRAHDQYAGRLERPDLERLVLQGHGASGANPDYVRNTQEHLAQLGIRDATLDWLVQRLCLSASNGKQLSAEAIEDAPGEDPSGQALAALSNV
jgi:glutathione-specific gamma-glutamylcyclotransferase